VFDFKTILTLNNKNKVQGTDLHHVHHNKHLNSATTTGTEHEHHHHHHHEQEEQLKTDLKSWRSYGKSCRSSENVASFDNQQMKNRFLSSKGWEKLMKFNPHSKMEDQRTQKPQKWRPIITCCKYLSWNRRKKMTKSAKQQQKQRGEYFLVQLIPNASLATDNADRKWPRADNNFSKFLLLRFPLHQTNPN